MSAESGNGGDRVKLLYQPGILNPWKTKGKLPPQWSNSQYILILLFCSIF